MDITHKVNRGSEWRKWDLHIHTPGTQKADNFDGQNLEEKWKRYIKTINESLEKISVVGITDYVNITNYFKFKELIKTKEITKQFDLIIPNIELRILPVTANTIPINLHCLFNPAIDKEIEDRFLSKLTFRHGTTNYSAKPTELCRLGRAIKQNQELEENAAIRVGCEQYVINFETLRDVFDKDPDLRKNCVIVVSNKSNDGVTGIVRHEGYFTQEGSQLDATRQTIYQFSDAIFSSNESDRKYFLGQKSDNKNEVIRKCGSLKPCYHGCDAHDNHKVFRPDENRFCWIKADPTFEGLLQTLYEPDDRIRIQPLKPDLKNDRFIISQIKFKDGSGKVFSDQPILLNENLNSIIGGKSAGKSLLLYSTAMSIDPDQVKKAAQRLGFEGYKFKADYDFEVTWKNGLVNTLKGKEEKTQKIIYIPQLYINYLVEKDNKEDLNKLVENILLQDPEFRIFFDEIKEKIKVNNEELDLNLSNYIRTREKALNLQQRKKEIGASTEIQKSIDSISEAIKIAQKSSTLSPEEFNAYSSLMEQKARIEKTIDKIKQERTAMVNVLAEIKSHKHQLLGNQVNGENAKIKGSIEMILDDLNEIPQEILEVKNRIGIDYNALISNLESKISLLNHDVKEKLENQKLEETKNKLLPFNTKLEGQKELQRLISNQELEKKKLESAITHEKQFQVALLDYHNIRTATADILKKRYENYESIAEYINQKRRNVGSGVSLDCSLIFKDVDFPLFNQVNRATLSKEHIFNSLFNEDLLNYRAVPEFYKKPIYVKDNKTLTDNKNSFIISLKQGFSLEEVLRGLIKDEFILDYSVTYKGDDLLHMSPGKKGTVLLILFLQISSSEYPILIDQPEDNLDNRTIYELLCNMIKQKKKDRQIIIVSHNANLVVATDSENIIVANQQGQGDNEESNGYQFEYVNGSIENSFPQNKTISKILNQQGIREHVCDILEGGNEAFKQRERKYSIK